MLKRLLLVVMPCLLAAETALAEGDMSAFFDNTLVMSLPEGGEVRMHINADNTYSGTSSDGREFGGIWEIKDGKACFTRQPATHAPLCESYPGKQVGDSWEGTINAGGTVVTVTLVAGR